VTFPPAATEAGRTVRAAAGRPLVAGLVAGGSCLFTNVYFVGWRTWPPATLAYILVAAVLGYRRLSQVVGQRRGWVPSVVLASFWLASTGGVHEHLGSYSLGVLAMLIAGAQIALVVRLACEELWSYQPSLRPGGRRWMLLYAGVPLAYWGSYLVAYFPARMTYDSFWQWGMAHHTKQYNDWHPMLNTWLIEATSHIWNSPSTYIILQLVLAVSVLAYALWSLQSFGAPRWVTVALCLVYTAYPASALFSVTMWKDFPFAYLVLLTTTMLAWIVWTRGAWLRHPGAVVALSIACFLTMHMRRNGLPAILLALVLAVAFLPSLRRRLGLITAGLVVAHLLWAGVLLPQFHTLKPPATAALAIPTQQIGATYARGGVFAPEVDAYFSRILPAQRWRADYRQDLVNPIKGDTLYRDAVVSKSLPTYLVNWGKLLADNPSTFVGAFLDQTSALWQYTPERAGPHVYVGGNVALQKLPLQVRMLHRLPANRPAGPPYAATVDALYGDYNPNGCAPENSACRPADHSDCFGEATCATLAEFTARADATIGPLVTSPGSHRLNSIYTRVYRHLDTDWQGPLARGAIPLFLLALALAVAVRRDRLRMIVFLPAVLVVLSLAAGMPASDLRYSYGWIVSVPFLLVLALLPRSDAVAVPDDQASSEEGSGLSLPLETATS
jgi:hypothetical protein